MNSKPHAFNRNERRGEPEASKNVLANSLIIETEQNQVGVIHQEG